MTFKTHNDLLIPGFMYGTAWKKEDTARLVKTAVRAGFKAIDTANQLVHYNEEQVGQALVNLAEEGFNRETLFLQTKFTSVRGQANQAPYDITADLTTQVNQSFALSLDHLQTDHVDSYVLHGPYTGSGLTEADWEVWAALEEIYHSGRAKMIGISNVNPDQLRVLCAGAKVEPMVVQNRCYAALGWDREIREICREHQVVYQGFSLLTANRGIFVDPGVAEIARRLGATAAQVVFRFAVDLGMLPLTGTTDESHMKEDLLALDLELLDQEVLYLENIAASTQGG